jgi:AcrR family transcriptional regulator
MPTKTKPYHRTDLETDLLRHAAEIIVRKGVEGLSLRKLGTAANVSRAAPYHYFDSKDALLKRVGEFGFQKLSQRILETVGDKTDPARRLQLGFRGYLDFALAEPHLFRLMFANALRRDLEAAPHASSPAFAFSSEAAQSALALMIEGVAQWQKTRRGDKRDPLLLANVFWSFVHGLAVLSLDQNLKHKNVEKVFDAGLDLLMAQAT